LTGGGGKPERRAGRKAEEPKKGRFGLSKLAPTGGGERSRRSDRVRRRAESIPKDSKGGPNPAPVVVKIAAADIAAFKKRSLP
jgi:hypothetical protein